MAGAESSTVAAAAKKRKRAGSAEFDINNMLFADFELHIHGRCVGVHKHTLAMLSGHFRKRFASNSKEHSQNDAVIQEDREDVPIFMAALEFLYTRDFEAIQDKHWDDLGWMLPVKMFMIGEKYDIEILRDAAVRAIRKQPLSSKHKVPSTLVEAIETAYELRSATSTILQQSLVARLRTPAIITWHNDDCSSSHHSRLSRDLINVLQSRVILNGYGTRYRCTQCDIEEWTRTDFDEKAPRCCGGAMSEYGSFMAVGVEKIPVDEGMYQN